MRTANPVFQKLFDSDTRAHADSSNAMTVAGTIYKSLAALLILLVGAAFSWMQPAASAPLFMGVGAIGGLIASLVVIFAPSTAPVSVPIYAALEGLFLGALSALVERAFPGMVFQAVGLTFSVLLCMLGAYRAGWIKVTEKLRAGIFLATASVAVVYLSSMVLGLFGVGVPFIHEGGTFGILFSLLVVGIASFNLLLDFDYIEKGAAQGAPKKMEWLGAFGLMVTLVWLYVEILRLLMKLAASRD
jgi:uncharacterized YccA/Bax inhibitor family protein